MPRSPSEIRFRLLQELTNLRLLSFPPSLSGDVVARTQSPCAKLPEPREIAKKLKHTPYATECVAIAEEILAHRFPLLGTVVTTGPEIRWRRDYASGIESPAAYFRRVPYLDATKAGDHKNIWELNRHQHLVLLAQAHLFTGRAEFLDEIVRELESWFEQNPYQRGINWSSALEVAFRALSWIWIWHLVGGSFDSAMRQRFLDGLYRHALHLAANLSFYFSPNTHLLGEAVALHALGELFPEFPVAGEWRAIGARTVRTELDHQVQADGSHFEQSTYYHVYGLDMFLFHAILASPDAEYRAKLAQMAEFLDAIMGVSRTLPFFGDDDGGRLFHPYGDRSRFGRGTLAACGVFLNRVKWIPDRSDLQELGAWWLPAADVGVEHALEQPRRASVRFENSGLHVMAAGDVQLIVDAGPFGPGSAGHSHADTLSIVIRRGKEQILIDPGTYTYVGDPVWRDRFRGTAAHNTVRMDGLDQATPGGPFGWKSRPEVRLVEWTTTADGDFLRGECAYAGFRHQRDVVFSKLQGLVIVVDRVDGVDGLHRVEQFWHFGEPIQQISPDRIQIGSAAIALFDRADRLSIFEGDDVGWKSVALGTKSPSPVACVERSGPLPVTIAAVFDLSGEPQWRRFTLDADGSGIDLSSNSRTLSIAWMDRLVHRIH